MAQGKIGTDGLTAPQLKFTIDVMAMLMDKLIQDDIMLDEAGDPLPAQKQEDQTIRSAMQMLNYK